MGRMYVWMGVKPNLRNGLAQSKKIFKKILGHALFAMTSLMSHNCISNSKTIIKSDYSGECRATSFIPAGEEITKQVLHSGSI